MSAYYKIYEIQSVPPDKINDQKTLHVCVDKR
jgi:hypothetical protein